MFDCDSFKNCMIKDKKIKIITIFFLSLLMIFKFFSLYSTVYLETEHRHPDEDCHLQNTYYYKLLFIDRDINNPEWKNFIFYDQPPVAKYIMGFALHLYNNTIVDNVGGVKNWHNIAVGDFWMPRLIAVKDDGNQAIETRTEAQNLITYAHVLLKQTSPIEKINSFTDRDIIIGRLTIFLFEILATLVLILTVTFISKRLILGLIAGLLFITNPITIPTFQIAYIDSIWCFFVFMALFLLLLLLKTIRKADTKKTILYSFFIGISLALAIGTKVIASYAAVAVTIVLGLNFILNSMMDKKIKLEVKNKISKLNILSFLIISVSSLIIFVALNPFLYHNTIHNFFTIFEHRGLIMDIQSLTQGSAIRAFSDRVGYVVQYGIFNDYKFAGLIGLSLAWGYILVLIIGATKIIKKSLHELKNNSVGPYLVVVVFSLSSFILIGSTVHMGWERYFLPLMMSNILWFSFGIEAIFDFCIKTVTHLTKENKDSPKDN
jgi:hypothetical protein